MSEYVKDDSGETWWCNIHRRKAEYLFHGKHVCDPSLGGILFPCFAVNLTDQAEIVDES